MARALSSRSGTSNRKPTREETWQSTTNQRSTPTARKSVLRVSRVDFRNQHAFGVHVLLNAGSSSQRRAGHSPKSVSLTANRNDTAKTLIHIYIQKFCFAGA
jgi:hypothetical protein